MQNKEDSVDQKSLIDKKEELEVSLDQNSPIDEDDKEDLEEKAYDIIEYASQMSSKLAEVGRAIILALMAGSWILLRFYKKSNPDYSIFIKLSLVCAFVYLIIDLLYYSKTMMTYYNLVKFNYDKSTIYIDDKKEAFRKQAKSQKLFLTLATIKTIILFLSIIFVCLYIFI